MNRAKHILIFEPQIEGHHLFWVAMLCEDFLSAGYTVSLALDTREGKAQERLLAINPTLLNDVVVLPTHSPEGKWVKQGALQTLAYCFKESGADEVFVNNLDEFASKLFRRAAFGLRPPSILKGKISGIYHRPRPLDFSQSSLNNKLKRWGLKRLCREGWIANIFLVDEFTLESMPKESSEKLQSEAILDEAGLGRESWKRKPIMNIGASRESRGRSQIRQKWIFTELSKDAFLGTRFSWLPDPWVGEFSDPQYEAREALGIPQDRLVFLNYGVAARRKGLHLAIDALKKLPDDRVFLLSAGRLGNDKEVLNGIQALEDKGCAKALNYYVTPQEEALAFRAADIVLLPYLSHFGSANVLARAAAANRPVIASDYHLLGERVKRYGLGLTFKNESVEDLHATLEEVLGNSEKHLCAYSAGLKNYKEAFSREAFREALLKEYPPATHT